MVVRSGALTLALALAFALTLSLAFAFAFAFAFALLIQHVRAVRQLLWLGSFLLYPLL